MSDERVNDTPPHPADKDQPAEGGDVAGAGAGAERGDDSGSTGSGGRPG